jgi:hypothetical protein
MALHKRLLKGNIPHFVVAERMGVSRPSFQPPIGIRAYDQFPDALNPPRMSPSGLHCPWRSGEPTAAYCFSAQQTGL